MPLLFEATSAIGTVGISLKITAGLSDLGKLVIIALMFIGRLGVITFGLTLTAKDEDIRVLKNNDIAV